jgi:hypothetical protein
MELTCGSDAIVLVFLQEQPVILKSALPYLASSCFTGSQKNKATRVDQTFYQTVETQDLNVQANRDISGASIWKEGLRDAHHGVTGNG